MESISEVRANYPATARTTVVAPLREGFSRDIQQALQESRIKLLAPIQFFDSRFRVEESKEAASSIADIREDAKSMLRVPQSFRINLDTEDDRGPRNNQDIFLRLKDDLSKSDGAAVRIVVGRAGIGNRIFSKRSSPISTRTFLTPSADSVACPGLFRYAQRFGPRLTQLRTRLLRCPRRSCGCLLPAGAGAPGRPCPPARCRPGADSPC